MTTKPPVPLPRPTRISKPYWEGCRRGELLYQKCRACGKATFIPQYACMHCLSPDLEWARSACKGKVYSYTVVWRPQTPAFEVPYVVAIVDVDEGYQMMTNIVGCEPDDVRVGMRVEVEFRRMSDEITLPYFRPAT